MSRRGSASFTPTGYPRSHCRVTRCSPSTVRARSWLRSIPREGYLGLCSLLSWRRNGFRERQPANGISVWALLLHGCDGAEDLSTPGAARSAYLGLGYVSWIVALLILGYVDKPILGTRLFALPDRGSTPWNHPRETDRGREKSSIVPTDLLRAPCAEVHAFLDRTDRK